MRHLEKTTVQAVLVIRLQVLAEIRVVLVQAVQAVRVVRDKALAAPVPAVRDKELAVLARGALLRPLPVVPVPADLVRVDLEQQPVAQEPVAQEEQRDQGCPGQGA